LPKTGRISALASRQGAYERVTPYLLRHYVQQLSLLVTSSLLKAALFRASGPGRRGFSGAEWPHCGRVVALTGPAACGGGKLISERRSREAAASEGLCDFPRYPPFLSSE
jgi:hypothetical protein